MSASESKHQRNIIKWARGYKELRWLHAIPNGGYRRPREAARLVAEGVKKGVYDLFLPLARHGYHGLYIEMKKEGGRLSAQQKLFKRDLEQENYKCVECWGEEEAKKEIRWYITS